MIEFMLTAFFGTPQSQYSLRTMKYILVNFLKRKLPIRVLVCLAQHPLNVLRGDLPGLHHDPLELLHRHLPIMI